VRKDIIDDRVTRDLGPSEDSMCAGGAIDLVKVHRDFIDKARRERDLDFCRMSYRKWVEAIRQRNAQTGGALAAELEAAQREFSDFVRNDPLYQVVLERLVPIVQAKPGILQTDLYRDFTDAPRDVVSYVLYFAADHGVIVREKRGRTYAITLAKEG
jgi:hypothetical protein